MNSVFLKIIIIQINSIPIIKLALALADFRIKTPIAFLFFSFILKKMFRNSPLKKIISLGKELILPRVDTIHSILSISIFATPLLIPTSIWYYPNLFLLSLFIETLLFPNTVRTSLHPKYLIFNLGLTNLT